MIKTFNGNHETTVDPSMMQAALDQGIRPVGYDSPITEEPQACCADRCKVFLDGSYRRGQVETIEKVLEIIDDNLPEGEIWKEYDDDWHCGWRDASVRIRKSVQALKGGEEE